MAHTIKLFHIVSETHTFEAGYKKIIKIWYLDPNICNDTYHFVSFALLVLALQLSQYPRHLFLHNSCYTHIIKRELAYFVNCRYGDQNCLFVRSRHFKNTIKPLYIWLYMPQKNSEIKAVTNTCRLGRTATCRHFLFF